MMYLPTTVTSINTLIYYTTEAASGGCQPTAIIITPVMLKFLQEGPIVSILFQKNLISLLLNKLIVDKITLRLLQKLLIPFELAGEHIVRLLVLKFQLGNLFCF